MSEIASAIQMLRNSSSIRKTKVGRIRELMPEIRIAQQAGVRLTDIADLLCREGFEGMNLKCLQNLLYQSKRSIRNDDKYRATKPKSISAERISTDRSSVIDAESIIEGARNSMNTKPASDLTLSILRSTSTKERK